MRTFALALGASVVLLSASASAHFKMVMPPSPTASVDGKGAPPCGPDTGDGMVTPVTGGSMIPFSVNENVRHGGFYRVALALKSCKTAGCFPADNKVYDSANKLLNPTGPGSSDHADIDPAPKFPILADGLFKHTQDADGTGPAYTGMINIPNVTCDKCTLQVIEFMTPHGPNDAGAGYFYHHCADLKITADPGKPIFDPNGTGGSGNGGASTGGAAGAAGSGGAGGSGGTAAGAGGTGIGTAGTAPTTAGTPATAGTTSTAGSTSVGGTTTTPVTSGAAQDDGGCGIAKRTQGGASFLAALGLLFALGRRRRTR